MKQILVDRDSAQAEARSLRLQVAALREGVEESDRKLHQYSSENDHLKVRVENLKRENRTLRKKCDEAVLQNFGAILDTHKPSIEDKFK